jgi:hypothetical protein
MISSLCFAVRQLKWLTDAVRQAQTAKNVDCLTPRQERKNHSHSARIWDMRLDFLGPKSPVNNLLIAASYAPQKTVASIRSK